MSGEYPGEQRQGGMYAVQYLRWLVESGQVNELGPAAFTLLSVVVMREDALHYRRPPNFWQSQLMADTGLKSKATLATATQRLVDAGLLAYEPGNKRNPGVYYTLGFGSNFEPQIDGKDDSVQKLNRKSSEPVPNGPGFGSKIEPQIDGKDDSVQKLNRKSSEPVPNDPDSVQKLNRKSAPPNPDPSIPLPKIFTARFTPPTIEEVRSFCLEHSLTADPAAFWDYYESNGWKVGKSPMKDWHAALRGWARRNFGGQAPALPTERRKMDTWRGVA